MNRRLCSSKQLPSQRMLAIRTIWLTHSIYMLDANVKRTPMWLTSKYMLDVSV